MIEGTTIKTASDTLENDYSALGNCKPMARLSITSLDEKLGGVVPGHLNFIAGEPGAGKTSFCDQLKTELAAQGLFVVYATYETSVPQLTAKSISRLSDGGIKVGEVGHIEKSSNARPESEFQAFANYSQLAERIIYPEGRPSPHELNNLVREIGSVVDTGVALIADYVQMIPPDIGKVHADERSRLTDAVAELRNIANDYNAAVFAVTSITRQSYGKTEAKLDLCAGAQAFEYNADSVILLTVQGKGDARASALDNPVRPVVASFLKNRYGKTGNCALDFHTEYATFTERGAHPSAACNVARFQQGGDHVA